ncbi:homospermidine synthase [Shewanella litorisediminis]|uniref:Homospermidine synthase n=1 Tax=Shewanella litorisediminis TaxID=1173586 RepID=A0ABX7G2S3_9GAMM|nr:saccharopine dehydrogenase NADP-binding domain-containing protein [Shewanella litorisediminis]MCL2917068.1 saccharopine dehydrogenase NADP-binding domain-containing protein [Shewanella litorisediminis]QRH01550.1 homospermidine synthase [Shewanella litorisediminis]
MTQPIKYVKAPGRILIVGFGSIGQGLLPLILRHIDISPKNICIITADDRGREEADKLGIRFIEMPLTRKNYQSELMPLLGKNDFLVNLSVDVSSIALIEFCQARGARYLDTCIEPWAGGYTDPSKSFAARSNYALRERVLALKDKYRGGPTAVVAQGANPGMVSHLVKQALMNLQQDILGTYIEPKSREDWAKLAHDLNIEVIHIAERDTQVAHQAKAMDEFVNTWSCDGFVSEGAQPAELGWGTHEKHFPRDGGRHEEGCGAAIYLKRPGATVKVRTWTPNYGHFHGFLITHNEAISIADFFTLKQEGKLVYRPTCHYAYHPCDDAVMSLHEFNGKNFQMQSRQRLMRDEIVSGMDELGVLLAGHKKNAYWYGSQLSIEEARALAPFNGATSLQVTSAALAGIVWALENPNAGVVESDEMDYRRNLEIMGPYLGPVVGEYTDWTPLYQRGELFPEDVDDDYAWQFKNVRV